MAVIFLRVLEWFLIIRDLRGYMILLGMFFLWIRNIVLWLILVWGVVVMGLLLIIRRVLIVLLVI